MQPQERVRTTTPLRRSRHRFPTELPPASPVPHAKLSNSLRRVKIGNLADGARGEQYSAWRLKSERLKSERRCPSSQAAPAGPRPLWMTDEEREVAELRSLIGKTRPRTPKARDPQDDERLVEVQARLSRAQAAAETAQARAATLESELREARAEVTSLHSARMPLFERIRFTKRTA